MLIRIVKQYNNRSAKNGIIEVDQLSFESLDAAAQFISKVNANRKIDYDIIDYERALITSGNKEIIVNPTGGYMGKL